MKMGKKEKNRKKDALEIVAALFVAWLAYQVIALATGT